MPARPWLTRALPCLLLLSGRAIEPTHRDVAYDNDHPAQCLDVYQATSATPTPVVVYIHGGGWRGGSKRGIPGFLASAVNEGWLSVVAVEYRFTDVAPHPAQARDCQRAVQFARSKAREWNLDPTRVGATGGSAGAHLSLWIALHDDAANREAADPVERESSRVACAVGFAGPTDWRLLSTLEHKHPAYRQLLGYAPGTPAAEMAEDLKVDVSPVNFASKDDPPVLLVHGDADDIVPIEHSRVLDERLDAVGVPSELLVIPGARHEVAGGGGAAAAQAKAFFRKHLAGSP